jgi:hypothetical protein
MGSRRGCTDRTVNEVVSVLLVLDSQALARRWDVGCPEYSDLCYETACVDGYQGADTEYTYRSLISGKECSTAVTSGPCQEPSQIRPFLIEIDRCLLGPGCYTFVRPTIRLGCPGK